ncbi:hypothetical protein BaRGS_00003772, partial [Batillaria attramentaria]
ANEYCAQLSVPLLSGPCCPFSSFWISEGVNCDTTAAIFFDLIAGSGMDFVSRVN